MKKVRVHKVQIHYETVKVWFHSNTVVLHRNVSKSEDKKKLNMAENMRKTKKETESSSFLAGWLLGQPQCWWCVKSLASSAWCLLCYKTEYDSNGFVFISTVIGYWADLANRPWLAHAFTSKTNKDKRVAAEEEACHLSLHNILS